MTWQYTAASNLALIKYMGKTDPARNLPSNASCSYALTNLTTTVSLSTITGRFDQWDVNDSVTLSEASITRFLKHLQRIKDHFNYSGAFLVRSQNNFPQGVGLASSASSFAALTGCAGSALAELTKKNLLSIDEQAALSRLGSGSSCRSFYSPWAYWKEEKVCALETPYPVLLHQAVLINPQEKQVSSSEAHRRVQSSPYFLGRSARAEARLTDLLKALAQQNWTALYRICFEEFMDMHQLFETSDQPFSYLTQPTRDLLKALQSFWDTTGDGPLITMDAGETIHLLYRPDQADLRDRIQETFLRNYHVF